MIFVRNLLFKRCLSKISNRFFFRLAKKPLKCIFKRIFPPKIHSHFVLFPCTDTKKPQNPITHSQKDRKKLLINSASVSGPWNQPSNNQKKRIINPPKKAITKQKSFSIRNQENCSKKIFENPLTAKNRLSNIFLYIFFVVTKKTIWILKYLHFPNIKRNHPKQYKKTNLHKYPLYLWNYKFSPYFFFFSRFPLSINFLCFFWKIHKLNYGKTENWMSRKKDV